MDVVEDVMTKKVVTCMLTATILEVQKLMVGHRISRIVVVEAKNKPVGIITQKDIVNFLLADKSRRGLEEIRGEEVMSKDLVTTKPAAPISGVARTMIRKKISSLVVVDEDGKLKGIVTKADVVMYLASKGAGIYSVRDFMTSNPITVKPSHPIFLAASLMSEHGISRVVVVDKENKPVGIITLADVTTISALLKPAKVLEEGKPIFMKGFIALPKSIHLLTAEDVMTAHPVLINKDADLADAAKLIVRHAVSGLPVIDNSGKLVGIVTKSDLTRAVAFRKE